MTIIERLQAYIDNLDERQFKIYVLIFLAALGLFTGLILFRYYHSIRTLKRKITTINKKRTSVRELLERNELVKRQQKDVDAILAKEKDFKISQFFENILSTLAISKDQVQSLETRSEDVLDGYTEWTLDARLNKLNMKKLTELLNEIEKEERIYTKELEIIKEQESPAIDVKITIATLEQKITPEVVE